MIIINDYAYSKLKKDGSVMVMKDHRRKLTGNIERVYLNTTNNKNPPIARAKVYLVYGEIENEPQPLIRIMEKYYPFSGYSTSRIWYINYLEQLLGKQTKVKESYLYEVKATYIYEIDDVINNE